MNSETKVSVACKGDLEDRGIELTTSRLWFRPVLYVIVRCVNYTVTPISHDEGITLQLRLYACMLRCAITHCLTPYAIFSFTNCASLNLTGFPLTSFVGHFVNLSGCIVSEPLSWQYRKSSNNCLPLLNIPGAGRYSVKRLPLSLINNPLYL